MLNVNLMYLGPITGAVAYKWVGELIRGGGGAYKWGSLYVGGGLISGGAYTWGGLISGGAYTWGGGLISGGAYTWGVGGGGL